jgi:hypothetical protein
MHILTSISHRQRASIKVGFWVVAYNTIDRYIRVKANVLLLRAVFLQVGAAYEI